MRRGLIVPSILVTFPASGLLILFTLITMPSLGQAHSAPDYARLPFVRSSRGLVSIDAENTSLKELLGKLSRASGVPIIYKPSEATDPKISVRFRDLPFDEAMRRLLRGCDYIMLYQGSRLVKAIVWPKDRGMVVAREASPPQAPMESETNPSLMERSGEMPSPGLRAASRERRPPEVTQPIAEAAFNPEETNLRIAAVQALSQMNDPNAVNVLSRAATHEDPRVRMTAIEALGSLREPWAANLLQRAAEGDAEEAIRERAKELLERYQ